MVADDADDDAHVEGSPATVEILEPTLGSEAAPMMEPTGEAHEQAPASATSPSRYWQAQGLAATLLSEFDEARQSDKHAVMRERFYLLASYYTRTIAILRYALRMHREPLAQATLHNLIALYKSLHHMREASPSTVPSILALNRAIRPRLLEALVVSVLETAPGPLDLATVTRSVNDLDVLADASDTVLRRHMNNLIATGHVELLADGTFARTTRRYSVANLDQMGLQALFGPELYAQISAAGFAGLADVVARKAEFRGVFARQTRLGDATAVLFVAVAELLAGLRADAPDLTPWRHVDLIGSAHVRPYQYEAYAVFRGYGYQGQVVEAPTGSGKSLIGMLCIQDWLRTLSEGQSILILVPTVNYQQQWVGELCYKPVGLHLSPHLVYTGTPAQLETTRARLGIAPCVIVMTYAALAQTGSGVGKGGFDQDSIEIFLQGNNIQHVILDEVHKVVEDVRSISAAVTRTLAEWVHDGSLRGLIGFSGTAAMYRPRFAELGLQLVYILPAADLVAYGFVAPFAEFGVPFAFSDREQRVRDLLADYKACMRDYIALLGSARLRQAFGALAMEERVTVGRDLLRMYVGEKDQHAALEKRFTAWEHGGDLSLTELPLLSMLQLAHGWSDHELFDAMGGPATETDGSDDAERRQASFAAIVGRFEAIRDELRSLMYAASMLRRLDMPGFAHADVRDVRAQAESARSAAARVEVVKDGLAPTIVGLYSSLSDWYLRVGEGRVDSIKAIIEAERAARTVHGTIVFDAATRLRWQSGVAVPGYAGVAGVFSQMLGDERFTPIAVLSNEMYLAYNPDDPLPVRIAEFIKQEIMQGELADALFGLATEGLPLEDERREHLRAALDGLLATYVEGLTGVGTARPREFYRRVLGPFRRVVRSAHLGATRDRLLARISLRHYHIRNWLETFFNYALIVGTFMKAHIAELEQVSGAHQNFYVVRMGQGDRKQLMYDLSARIVDAEHLPVNVIIVSPWARTGWNVIKPNVLIDATATRDVTAWQQLRGRAMRAMRTWTTDCYRVVLTLMSGQSHGLVDAEALPEDVVSTFAEVGQHDVAQEMLDASAQALLLAVCREARHLGYDARRTGLLGKIERGTLADLTPDDRAQLVTDLLLTRNKVTHIYELVKASGSTSQVHFDRPTGHWVRTESIAEKHGREYAVSPLDGTYAAGTQHAPLIYAGDPRRDLPSGLQSHLSEILSECDPRIVRGWLHVIGAGADDEIGVE